MAAAIMRDHPEALVQEEEHLRVPVVGAERPAMMEDDRLGVLWAPVLVIDFGVVFGCDDAHGLCSYWWGEKSTLMKAIRAGRRRVAAPSRSVGVLCAQRLERRAQFLGE